MTITKLWNHNCEVKPTTGKAEADEFIASLEAMPASGWARIELNAAASRERLWPWDRAWESAVARGGYAAATTAMSVARRRGASRIVQALAGGAAAALHAGGEISADDFRELYLPFAHVLPVGELTGGEVRLAAAG